MKAPEEIVSYTAICEHHPTPSIYFNTYNEAVHWAKFNQPTNRPYYIIESVEHFEICGVVGDTVESER